MNYDAEIERILRLQNAAYELLLWIDTRAQGDQSWLRDDNIEKWRYAESCEVWVRAVHGMIPQDLRPAEADVPAFARLFSSFFATSFRVVNDAPAAAYDYFGHQSGYKAGPKRRLMAGAPAPKKSSKAKARVRDNADELRHIALEELALQYELLPDETTLKRVEARHARALTKWTYFHELERRANYASQGAAVRSLWQDMPKHEREKLDAPDIIAARDEILEALGKTNSQT